jgi:hypothetical protein
MLRYVNVPQQALLSGTLWRPLWKQVPVRPLVARGGAAVRVMRMGS